MTDPYPGDSDTTPRGDAASRGSVAADHPVGGGSSDRSPVQDHRGVIESKPMQAEPSTNGGNGRDTGGRFAKGNPGGPGNPHARRVARLRTLLLETVTDDDLRAIVRAMVEQAKRGDLAAIREVLNRLIGRPTDSVDPDRLDLDEHRLAHESADAKERAEDPDGWAIGRAMFG